MASRVFRGVILGAPASGKGTISSRIVERFKITHLSSGDLLRNQVKKETEIGKKANEYIKNGLLVPDNLVTEMVTKELEKLTNSSWLLDGFPRTGVQAEFLHKSQPLNMVLNLVVPFEVIVNRVKGRWLHVPSGRVYNLDFNAPKKFGIDDVTGEPLEQREDDKPEAVRKRLEIYQTTVIPVLDYYKKIGILREFRGNTSDEIWPKVDKALVPYF